MSVPVGGMSSSSSEQFEQVSSDDHQMSLAGGRYVPGGIQGVGMPNPISKEGVWYPRSDPHPPREHTRRWKHYFPATTVGGGKYCINLQLMRNYVTLRFYV